MYRKKYEDDTDCYHHIIIIIIIISINRIIARLTAHNRLKIR